MRTNIRLLAWGAAFGLVCALAFFVGMYGGGFAIVPAVTVPYPPMKPDIKVWDASDGQTEPNPPEPQQ